MDVRTPEFAPNPRRQMPMGTYAAENDKTPEREALATMPGVSPREVADRRARATGSVVLALDFETPEGASPHEPFS